MWWMAAGGVVFPFLTGWLFWRYGVWRLVLRGLGYGDDAIRSISRWGIPFTYLVLEPFWLIAMLEHYPMSVSVRALSYMGLFAVPYLAAFAAAVLLVRRRPRI